jgi:hypothetical protein
MDSHWASDHLQAIRTLMERSALYRRALAPIMIVSGTCGTAGAILGHFLEVGPRFSLFWLGVGIVTLAAALFLVRKQALGEHEAFWSPPTRRVTTAVLPGFLVGLMVGLSDALRNGAAAWIVAPAWITIYGCALHAAAFFMQRGIKLFGWILILAGCGLLIVTPSMPGLQQAQATNYLMGFFFGVLHLAYGIYLYFTERPRNLP